MNIQQIKQAVDSGLSVKSGNDLYDVTKDTLGQYLIVCSSNNYTIGLHGQKGTIHEHVLNGVAHEFYIHTPPQGA